MKQNLSVIASYIRSRFTQWRSERTQLEMKWLGYYRQWRCLPDAMDAERRSERSKIKIPACKRAVSDYLNAVEQTVFSASPFFDLAPTNSANPRPALFRQYINYLLELQNYRKEMRNGLLEMGIYGTMIGRIRATTYTHSRLEQSQRMDERYDPETNTLVRQPITELNRVETDYVHPLFTHESIFNVYVPALGPDIQTCEGVIVRGNKSPFEMEQMFDAGVIEVLPDSEDTPAAPALDATETLVRRLRYQGWATQNPPNSQEVLEWWGYIPKRVLKEAGIEAERGQEITAIICGDKVLNPSSLFPPFWYKGRPFVWCNFEDVPDEMYGIGILEISSGPQKALDATVRSRIDNKAIAVNQLFAADAGKLTPGQDMGVYPGKVFLTEGDPNTVFKQFEIKDVTQGTYAETAQLEQWIQDAHGISKIIGGQATKNGEQSATEINTLASQSMGQIRTISMSVEKFVIAPMLRWYARILQQFRNDKEVFYSVDGNNPVPQMYTILAEDQLGDYDFIPIGTLTMSMQNKSQQLGAFLAQTANPIDAPITNRAFLLRKRYDTMGFNDGDRVIATPEQLAAQHQLMNGQPGQASQPAPVSNHPGEAMTAPGGTPNAQV